MADGSQFPTPHGGGRRSAPDEVWARAREDYLAGMSAPEVCRLHGVGVAALRARAARERWRRMDQPWTPPPNRLDVWDEGVALEDRVGGDLDRIELCELAFVAHRRMMRAVLRGDAAEALRWQRVRIAMDAEEAELDRLIAQDEAIRIVRAGQAETTAGRAGVETPDHAVDDVDSVDASDGVFPDRRRPPADAIPPGFTQ